MKLPRSYRFERRKNSSLWKRSRTVLQKGPGIPPGNYLSTLETVEARSVTLARSYHFQGKKKFFSCPLRRYTLPGAEEKHSL